MIKNILKQLLFACLGICTASIICLSVVSIFSYVYDNSCFFLNDISGNNLGMNEYIGTVMLSVCILGLGSILYLILNSKLKKIVYWYFFILTLASCSNLFLYAYDKIGITSPNRALEEVLCTKIEDDGMSCKMNNLTQIEYTYLGEIGFKMPELPIGINHNISVRYFRDSFFGEYSLNIDVMMRSKEPLDSLKQPTWKLINTFGDDSLEYNYHVSQM